MNQYELPIVYSKSPIEGNTTSKYIRDSDGILKVASIDINSNISVLTYDKTISINSICVVKEHCGQYLIQLCDEDEGEVILEVTINEELVDALKYAITQYKENKPTTEMVSD